MPDYEEKGIDFSTMRNLIKCCALVKIEPFSFESIAKKMNTDSAFLRYWYQKNLAIINKVTEIYPKEIEQEINRLKSET